MLSLKTKDISKRKRFKAQEKKLKSLKYLSSSLNVSKKIRLYFAHRLSNDPVAFPNRLVNRCVYTGRAKGVLRDFKASRIKFRELAVFGLLPGVTKAVW